MSTDTPPRQTSSEQTDTAHLRSGARVTVEEIALHLSSAAVLLRQLAYAAETPNEPVELSELIEQLRSRANHLSEDAAMMQRLAAITAGDVPLAEKFPDGRRWGAAVLEEVTDPTVIPTHRQLILLADLADPTNRRNRWSAPDGTVELRFPEAMAGVAMVESKAAAPRRAAERARAIEAGVMAIRCDRSECDAGPGEYCRTSTGRISEQPHKGRLAEATATVDARLGAVEAAPVVVYQLGR